MYIYIYIYINDYRPVVLFERSQSFSFQAKMGEIVNIFSAISIGKLSNVRIIADESVDVRAVGGSGAALVAVGAAPDDIPVRGELLL